MTVSNSNDKTAYICDYCGATYTEDALDEAYYNMCAGRWAKITFNLYCICPACGKEQLREKEE